MLTRGGRCTSVYTYNALLKNALTVHPNVDLEGVNMIN